MNNKRIVFIFIFSISAAVILFFWCRNVMSAKENPALERAVLTEKTTDGDPRAVLRAFYTAPPVVPHEIESRDPKDCLRCHLRVTKGGDTRVAMKTPHPQFSNCTQCHVPGLPGVHQEIGSSWIGLKEPKHGDRWFTLSPPTIPHRIALRENCLSCHDPENPDARIRTPHPQRTNCLQCHVPDDHNEFEAE
jgi:nitrate reductase cytochrome c-type subunit